MNITEANAVGRLVKALAGDSTWDGEDAAKALELLHDRAYRALSAGPDGAMLARAQEFLVDNCDGIEE